MEINYIIKLSEWKDKDLLEGRDKERDKRRLLFFLNSMEDIFGKLSEKSKVNINPDVILSPVLWTTYEDLKELSRKHPKDYKKTNLGRVTFDGIDDLKISFYPNSAGGGKLKWTGKKAPPFLKQLLKIKKEDLPKLECSIGQIYLDSFPKLSYSGADAYAEVNYKNNFNHLIEWDVYGNYCYIRGSCFKDFFQFWRGFKEYFPKSELTQKDFLKSLNRKELRGYVERHVLESKCREDESTLGNKKPKTGCITVCIIPDSYKKKPTIEYFLSDSDIAESDYFSRKNDIEKTINFFKENVKFLLEPWDSNSNHYCLKYFYLDLINKRLSDNMKLSLIEVEQKSLYAGAACGLAVQHLKGQNANVLDNCYNEIMDEHINNAIRKYEVQKTKLIKLYNELSQKKEAREKGN